MSNPPTERACRDAIDAAISFAERSQSDNGCWRDYELPPGRSEAWTTALVGHALTIAVDGRSPGLDSLRRAVMALCESQCRNGWGYNRATACDADSTSWALRFLTRHVANASLPASGVFDVYVTPAARVRTFASRAVFGSWASEHDEVAPSVGLALLASGDRSRAMRVRHAVIEAWTEGGWQPFWWRGRGYARSVSLDFLAASGGIPAPIARGEGERLEEAAVEWGAFDVALRLLAAIHLGREEVALRSCDRLLRLQMPDGGWPSSAELVVPGQIDSIPTSCHLDDRRLVTTATALTGLARWIESDSRVGGSGIALPSASWPPSHHGVG